MCFIVHSGSLFQPPGPKRRFLGPNPFQRGPFLVGSCFDRNIGMWGVQIVATEFSDDFRQLQLILNHPVGENVQKHNFGGLLEAKNVLLKADPQSNWKCLKRYYSNIVKPCRVFCAVLGIRGVSWGAQKVFSQLGSV